MILRRGLRKFTRRTLIVHTKDGKSLRGLLSAEYADCLVLSHPTLLDFDQRLGGEVVILRENVSWCQDVTGMDATVASELPDGRFTIPASERPGLTGSAE